jgi:hypothetical protein
MKFLITSLLVALLAVPALAVDSMGISAAMDTHETTVLVEPGTPFDFYIVLLDPSSELIGGYECGLSFVGDTPIVLGVSGPNGWTNFGGPTNHLVGYTEPLPAGPVTVLCTVNALVTAAPFEALVQMGPAEPSSFDGQGPGYSDGENPDILVLCDVPEDGIVGIITTEVVATEASTLTDVKNLFD